MVLGRPEAVEAAVGGDARQPEFLLPDLAVLDVVPAIAAEQQHHADIHGVAPRFVRRGGGRGHAIAATLPPLARRLQPSPPRVPLALAANRSILAARKRPEERPAR